MLHIVDRMYDIKVKQGFAEPYILNRLIRFSKNIMKDL